MKGEKKKASFYILGYLLEFIIKIWRSGKKNKNYSGEFEPFFFMENPFNRSKSYFSGQNLAKFRPPAKKRTEIPN
jgi:hypothetical protein